MRRTDQNRGRVISFSPGGQSSSNVIFSSGPTNPPGSTQGVWADWEGGVIYLFSLKDSNASFISYRQTLQLNCLLTNGHFIYFKSIIQLISSMAFDTDLTGLV